MTAGLLLLGVLGWSAAPRLEHSRPRPADETVAGLSDADRRQREILETALGNPADPALGRLFDDINARHFQGLLPAIPVLWEPRLAEVGALAAEAFTLEGMFGHVGDRSIILLNPDLSRDADAMRAALAHEMVHAWLHGVGDSSTEHGVAFQAELRRLAQEGAFRALAATAEDRRRLRQWLDRESARLGAEAAQARRESAWLTREAAELGDALETLGPDRAAAGDADREAIAAWNHRRSAYNDRVSAYRARVTRHRADLETFHEQVDRYNPMLADPDGLEAPAGPEAQAR